MLLAEMKIPDPVYCHNCLRYDVFLSEAKFTVAGGDQGGGVRLVLWERTEGWIVDSTRFHGPNMVSCEVIARYHQTPLIGAYLPLSTLDHLTDLGEALNRFLGRDSVILGDINADIGLVRNPQDKQVADFLAFFGFTYLL